MIITQMYNFCIHLKISPHSWHLPPQDFSLADMMRVFFFSDALPITWINIGGFWNCIHLHRTLVNPLDLIHKSPTLSAGEKGFGWGMLHSIADEKSNWGDFAAARHGMGVCVGVRTSQTLSITSWRQQGFSLRTFPNEPEKISLFLLPF